MFERIVLRRSEQGAPVSFGGIAEALLFYRQVQIILDRGGILDLISKIGLENFFRVVEQERVSVVYIEQHLGVFSQRVGLADHYQFIAFSMEGREPRRLSRKERAAEIFVRAGCDKKAAARCAERLLKASKTRSMTSDDYMQGGVVNAAKIDLKDEKFIKSAVRMVLQRVAPDYDAPHNLDFEIFDSGDHFQVSTNIDFGIVRRSEGASETTAASLLASILNARADLALAAHYGGDFKTSISSSEIVRIKHADVLRRSGINEAELMTFRDIVLSELPAVSEVLDSGERSPAEFFKLLDSSHKFASWTSGLNPDEKLVGEYFRAATTTGWIGSLKGKTIRFVLGTAVGSVEPVSGTALSFVDAFLADRIFGGWRPSHFVDNKLKPFLTQ